VRRPLSPTDALLLTALNVVWGSTYVVARGAMEAMPPLVLAGIRFGFAAAVMALLGMHRDRPGAGGDRETGSRQVLPSLLATGLLGFGLAKVLNYEGLVRSTATDAALIINLESVFTVLFAAWWLHQRPRAAQVAGLLVAGAGGVLLAWPQGGAGDAAARALGNLLMIGSVAAEALASVLGVVAMRRYSDLQVTALATYLGAAALAPFAWWQWEASGRSLAWATWPNLAAVAYLALGATLVAYVVWFRVLARVSAGQVAAFLYVQPVVGVALGVGLRGEWPTALGWGGGLCVLAGLWLTTRAADRRAEVDSGEPPGVST
jgi:O-acetylserine/cysteine efflux transporter